LSAAVASFISYPIKNASHYVTYDPLRCAKAARVVSQKTGDTASGPSGQQDVSLSYFDAAFILLIITNLAIVASTHVNQPSSAVSLQERIDIVMNVLYTCELFIRWIAYNSLFLFVLNNPFDFLVVLISDVFLVISLSSSISLPGVNIFRVVRLLRAFKLLHRVPRIKVLLTRLYSTVIAAIFPCLMLLFWVFCFAAAGLQLFKNNSISGSRLGFETFEQGYITSFSVITFEKWLDVLDGLVAQNQTVAIIFFVVFVSAGKYLGLNGIVASVLMTFSLDDVEKNRVQKEQYVQKMKQQQEIIKRYSATKARNSNRIDSSSLAAIRNDIAKHDKLADSSLQGSDSDIKASSGAGFEERSQPKSSSTNNRDSLGRSTVLSAVVTPAPVSGSSRVVNVLGLPFVGRADAGLQDSFWNARVDVLYCLTPGNSLRGLAVSIISSSWFSAIILISILSSVVLLLSPTPFKENPITPSITRTSDYVFQGIFVLEFVLKVIGNGFFGLYGYWQSPWNRLDMSIIIVGALDLVITAIVSDVQVLRFVRVFRMIRPLRLLNRFETLQVALFSLHFCFLNYSLFIFLTLFCFGFAAHVVVDRSDSA
jgi:hypothetical protein